MTGLIGWLPRRLHRALEWVFPDLPEYASGAGPVIPQAVVLRDGPRGREVLLVKRTSPRAWELPGGYAEPDEPPDLAVVREVREETSLEVEVERFIGWYRRTGFRPHLAPVYVCRPVAGTLAHSHESVEVAFFPVARLPLGLFPWYRAVIWDALRGVSYPTGREQRLGLYTVAASMAIHLGERLRLLR